MAHESYKDFQNRIFAEIAERTASCFVSKLRRIAMSTLWESYSAFSLLLLPALRHSSPSEESAPAAGPAAQSEVAPRGRFLTGLKNLVFLTIYSAIVLGLIALYSVSAILGFIATSVFVFFLLFSGGGSGRGSSGGDYNWWEISRGP